MPVGDSVAAARTQMGAPAVGAAAVARAEDEVQAGRAARKTAAGRSLGWESEAEAAEAEEVVTMAQGSSAAARLDVEGVQAAAASSRQAAPAGWAAAAVEAEREVTVVGAGVRLAPGAPTAAAANILGGGLAESEAGAEAAEPKEQAARGAEEDTVAGSLREGTEAAAGEEGEVRRVEDRDSERAEWVALADLEAEESSLQEVSEVSAAAWREAALAARMVAAAEETAEEGEQAAAESTLPPAPGAAAAAAARAGATAEGAPVAA